jgi:aspartate aminotransferase
VSADSEIIAIAPFFPEYRPFVESNGAKLVVVPADTVAFQINLEALEAAISPNTQGIIINSPNNPSGVVYTRETLEKLAGILERKGKEYGHPIYLISDEPYRELVYGGVEVPFVPTIYKNTIVCYSYSKSLSLPGERIGYVCVPDNVDDAADVYAAVAGAARAMGHVCPPTLMQLVIERCADEMPDLAAYDDNRTLLYNALTEMGYECAKPDGAFYLFVKAPNGDAVGFSQKAKLEHNLLVVPGDGFGCPGFMRLSYCVSGDMIRRSLPAFKAMIESYR